MGNITMSQARDEYIRGLESRRRSPETIRVDVGVLGRFVRDVGDLQLVNLKPHHIENWFYSTGGLMDEHRTEQYGRKTNTAISASTHNQYRSRLKVFFDWCGKRGYIKSDLLEHVEPLKVPAKHRQRPAPVTLLRIMDAASNARDRAWIATALNTALRSTEIKRIVVGDVDLEAGFMEVTITKTGDVDDQPISSDLDVELRRWMVAYAEQIGRPLEHDDLLFPARQGGLISHYDIDEEGNRVMVRHPHVWLPKQKMGRTEQIIKSALESLDLPTRYEGTHTIRRAVALAYFESVSRDQGDVAALRETAALLHHKNLHTTERYLGMTAEKTRRDRRLRGKPFLSAMVEPATGEGVADVVPLRPTGTGE